LLNRAIDQNQPLEREHVESIIHTIVNQHSSIGLNTLCSGLSKALVTQPTLLSELLPILESERSEEIKMSIAEIIVESLVYYNEHLQHGWLQL